MRKFLNTFAAISAGFLTQAVVASPSSVQENSLPKESVASALSGVNEKVSIKNDQGDVFDFVLKRNGAGQMMAWHESHASHTSHASHVSHYSSR